MSELSSSAQRVQDALDRGGVHCKVAELPASTRTAQEAADAVGAQVGQIVKSMIFRGQDTGQAVLILTSGANRVNVKKMPPFVGEPIGRADPDFVREETGYAIGGVPPLGHKKEIATLIDEDLMKYDTVWAAAGTPHAVFEVDPEDLRRLTSGKVIPVI
jgi:Cys-tRNA(Pro) deacylase